MEVSVRAHGTRFGPFDVDVRSGELHKHGIRLKLQPQPFQILVLLLKHPGEVVTRDEIRQALWAADTFVDFDTGLNSAIKKLRDVLDDSAEEPRYIETLPRRGYRFIAHVENGNLTTSVAVEEHLAPVPASEPTPKLWNKRHFLITACGAALLIVATLISWRVFFRAPALTETDTIVLASFVNNTGDLIFDDSLDKALEVKLTESPFLSLLPEADVRETMRTMRHDPNDRVTRDLGIEICRRRGLKAAVVPEIDSVGSTYLITLEAIDAQNGKSIARSQGEARDKDHVIAALGVAGANLRRQLGESLGSLKKYDTPLDLATTSSLEALQAYRTGLALYRSGKTSNSIPFFERAVEIDAEFGSAYAMLGMAYNNVGDRQASKRNFAKTAELKDRRLTQEENFRTTALYHSAITGNLEKEIAVLTLYQQAYPRSADVYNLSGRTYALLGQMDLALRQFDFAIDRSSTPSVSYYTNAAHVLMVLGRFDEARKILDQWTHKGTLPPSQKVMRYRIALLENDSATMEQLEREFSPDDVQWLGLQVQLAFLGGHFKTLRSLSNALVQREIGTRRMENAASALAWHGLLEAHVGNVALTRDLCRQAETTSKDNDLVLDYCAKALGHAGDFKQSEELAVKKAQLLPEDTRNQKLCEPEFYSIIERGRGNPNAAVDLLAPAAQYEQNTIGVPYERAVAYLAAGQSSKAATEFEKLLSDRGWDDWEVFAPLAQLGLARAYAMQGDREDSRKAYDDFFTTWKDADPDIPILRQAKAEYKSMRKF